MNRAPWFVDSGAIGCDEIEAWADAEPAPGYKDAGTETARAYCRTLLQTDEARPG